MIQNGKRWFSVRKRRHHRENQEQKPYDLVPQGVQRTNDVGPNMLYELGKHTPMGFILANPTERACRRAREWVPIRRLEPRFRADKVLC